jgi:hypothetical protein
MPSTESSEGAFNSSLQVVPRDRRLAIGYGCIRPFALARWENVQEPRQCTRLEVFALSWMHRWRPLIRHAGHYLRRKTLASTIVHLIALSRRGECYWPGSVTRWQYSATASRISSADLVQTNGLGSLFHSLIHL